MHSGVKKGKQAMRARANSHYADAARERCLRKIHAVRHPPNKERCQEASGTSRRARVTALQGFGGVPASQKETRMSSQSADALKDTDYSHWLPAALNLPSWVRHGCSILHL